MSDPEKEEPNFWRWLTVLVKSFFSKDKIQRSSGYFNLLLRTNPSWIDYLLVLGGVIFAIAAGIPYPILGILFGELVDDLNSSTCSANGSNVAEVESSVEQKVLRIIYVTVANFFAIYLHTGCWSLVGERLVRRLRKSYLQSLLKQEAAYFDLLSTGDVIAQLSSSIDVIQGGTSEKVGIVISTISYFVTAYIVSFTRVSRIAGMLVSLVPVYFIMAFGAGHLLKKYTARAAEHTNPATALASSSLAHIPIVHVFGSHQRLEKMFSEILRRAEKDNLRKAIVISCQLGFLYFVAYSANALAFWQGSRMIADAVGGSTSGVTVGAVYTVIFILLDASFILSQVAPFLHIFSGAVVAANKLADTINREPRIDPTSLSGTTTVTLGVDDIELDNVSFSYPAHTELKVLEGVSFKIPSNKHTAIVGPSGSGKSTLVGLLQRLYDPSSGALLVNGKDFREVNVSHLRSHIGLVQQEPALFNRSILENIANGLICSCSKFAHLQETLLSSSLPDAVERIRNGETEKQVLFEAQNFVAEIFTLVQQAAQKANALEFIESLSFGFATVVGPNGDLLSGGQKQRVAIARALVRQPNLLLLDEATAALDHANETLIQETLDKLSTTMTTVTIAHRLSTIQDANNIIVLQHGKVVEQGSHRNLIALNSAYANLVNLQRLDRSPASQEKEGLERPVAKHGAESTNKEGSSLEKCPDTAERDLHTLSSLSAEYEYHIQETNTANGGDQEKSQARAEEKKLSVGTAIQSSFILARPQIFFIFAGMVTSVIVGGSYSGEAVIFGHTIGILSPCQSESSIRSGGELFSLLFFALAILELAANITNGTSFGWVAQNVVYRARVLSFRSLLRQNLEWHGSEGRTSGTLISHLTSDATALSALTGSILGIILSTAVNLFAGIILSHVISWKIAIVLLPTIPVLLAAGFMRLHVLAQFQERHQKAFAEATSLAIEAVDQIKTVSAFSLESAVYLTFRRSLRGPYQASLKAIAYSNVWLSLAFSISNLVYALAFWWGSRQIVNGNATQTQFFMVLPALLFSTQMSGQLFALAPDLSKARIATGNVLRLLSSDPDPSIASLAVTSRLKADVHALSRSTKDIESTAAQACEAAPILGPGEGSTLSFVAVGFSYPSAPGKPVLNSLTLTIPPSTFCAIVGPSGAGKSTVMALLLSLFTPTSGTIILNGRPINPLKPTYLNSISYVPQSSSLLTGTIAFNVGLGAPPSREATQEEIEDACKSAHIHDTIMALPNGYNTVLKENASNLSGGQRQRLAIARALVRKPQLLLLDESTSALDAESEAKIQATLQVIRRTGVTVVAIAHRLSTIRNADRIFVFDAGRVADWGTHDELVQRCDIYRQGVVAQTLQL